MQIDRELVVEWTAPPSSSPLRYTVQYDTVPPSSGSLFTRDDIELLSLRIPENSLVFDQACSVRVQARDQRTGFYGAWSYAGTCYVNTTTPPGRPTISENGLTYVHPLFELKWDPPANSNGFISNYIIELMNETTEEDSDCDLCNQDTYMYSFLVKPDSTVYREVINVTASTCFCAAVRTMNGAGTSARSTIASKFYKYEPMIVIPPDVGRSTNNGDDGDDAAPIVAIVLGVVLVIIALVTLVLAVVFFKLYNSKMRRAGASESSKELNSSY